MIEYFSDEELGKIEPNSENITYPVWNGIVAIFEKFSQNNSLSSDFPEQCPDRKGIAGFDKDLFEDKLKAEIPNINIPIEKIRLRPITRSMWEEDEEIEEAVSTPTVNKYPVLDFLQFCYYHMKDPVIEGSIHEFFGHYHFSFKQDELNRNNFKEEINRIFERNGIVFYLDNSGQIKRKIPVIIKSIYRTNFKTSDSRLNELLHESLTNFILPKFEDRVRSLEKLWDAFERAKTFYGHDKKKSVDELLNNISRDNLKFKEEIEKECKSLSEIGNNFQIRHFETNKIEIKSSEHLDYLFYRMFSIINLFMSVLE